MFCEGGYNPRNISPVSTMTCSTQRSHASYDAITEYPSTNSPVSSPTAEQTDRRPLLSHSAGMAHSKPFAIWRIGARHAVGWMNSPRGTPSATRWSAVCSCGASRISARSRTCPGDRLSGQGRGRPGPARRLASWGGPQPPAGPMRGGEIPGPWPESVAILYRIWLVGIKTPEFGLAGPPVGALGCHHQCQQNDLCKRCSNGSSVCSA